MTVLRLSRIFLFCMGCILSINAFMLIAQKKIHLGIVLPLLIGLIFIIHALFWQGIQHYLKQHKILKKLWQGLWITFAIWLCSFLIFIGILLQNISQPTDDTQVKAIIVLGSGIEGNQPSPTLAKRLHRAAELAVQQKQALIIVSGGIGFTEKISEAEVMSSYLQTHYHISETRILKENQSTSTALNLQHSQSILTEHHITLTDPVAIVTSDFHTLRSQAIAHKQGYHHVIMLGAPTPLAIRYNAWLREYFAFISGWVLREY